VAHGGLSALDPALRLPKDRGQVCENVVLRIDDELRVFFNPIKGELTFSQT
jgi:hypothetical protein